MKNQINVIIVVKDKKIDGPVNCIGPENSNLDYLVEILKEINRTGIVKT